MPFQNIEQPRFIFNLLEYAKLSGAIEDISVSKGLNESSINNFHRVMGDKVYSAFDENGNSIDSNINYFADILDLSPYNDKTFFADATVEAVGIEFNITFKESFLPFVKDAINVFGIFGHNLGQFGSFSSIRSSPSSQYVGEATEFSIGTGINSISIYNGFLLEKYTTNFNMADNTLTISIFMPSNKQVNINSILVGKSFTIDNNPNMNISISKKKEQHTQTTVSGHSISSGATHEQMGWGSFPVWTLTSNPLVDIPNNYPDMFRIGKRRYDMGYTFLANTGVYAENLLDTEYGTPYDGNNTHILSESDTFYSNMMLLTHNGVLPFIFQTNKDEFIPQNFSFCTLDKSPSIRQTAFKSYDIRMQFTECF